MPALQVRDFPANLYEELRECAERNHRSIAQQTITCVEREIAREKAARAAFGSVGDSARFASDVNYDIPIPPNVREAAARARPVDPFNWMRRFEIETDAEIEARREKRRKLGERLSKLNEQWKGPMPTCDEIVAMIREDRDGRANAIVENAERFAAAAKKEITT